MNEYDLLDNGGPGSPGETTRVMTTEFLKQKNLFNSNESVIRKILIERANTYSEILQYDVLTPYMITRITEDSRGNLIFAIFFDVLITNHASGNLEGVLEHFDLILSVITNNYNNIVPSKRKMVDTNPLREQILNFMKKEKNNFD